jgi:hypothetical protein
VTFVKLFPEPKRRPETFRVATFAKLLTDRFALVTVFETTRFATGCVNAEAVTFVKLFPEPKKRPETFRVVMLAREAMRFETVSRLVTFRVVMLAREVVRAVEA